jgi:hypothetical protein
VLRWFSDFNLKVYPILHRIHYLTPFSHLNIVIIIGKDIDICMVYLEYPLNIQIRIIS